MRYFTSDLHFGHKNIVRGTSSWSDKSSCRNFNTIEEHDNAIIDGINSRVTKNDILYILGDISFGSISYLSSAISRINCRNLILIYGNHDDKIRKVDTDIFNIEADYLVIDSPKIIMFHYPIADWLDKNKGSMHLFGHCHQKFDTSGKGKMLDVSICGHNYVPWSEEEILEYMRGR